MASVEWKTLKGPTAMQASPTGLQVDWFNNRRLPEPIGYIPPAEAEERHFAQFNTLDIGRVT